MHVQVESICVSNPGGGCTFLALQAITQPLHNCHPRSMLCSGAATCGDKSGFAFGAASTFVVSFRAASAFFNSASAASAFDIVRFTTRLCMMVLGCLLGSVGCCVILP